MWCTWLVPVSKLQDGPHASLQRCAQSGQKHLAVQAGVDPGHGVFVLIGRASVSRRSRYRWEGMKGAVCHRLARDRPAARSMRAAERRADASLARMAARTPSSAPWAARRDP